MCERPKRFSARPDAAARSPRARTTFILGLAKSGSTSFSLDAPKHLPRGTRIKEAHTRERCFSAIPASYRVMTIVHEPRDNVLSQWRHCSNDLDGWFSPVGLPPTIEAWLEHWASVVAEDGSINIQPSSPQTFHCYLPFNLQTRILSCASTDPCLPYSTPALDTTVVADAAAGQAVFAPSLERAVRRVEAAERDGGIGFVAVLEHYQQSMCTLHAFERRELPQWCNCSAPRAWSTFPRSHVMHTTLQQQDNASHADRPPAQRLSARAVGLIDALTRMDRRLYEVSLARLRRDSARVEARYGTKLWCDVGSAAVPPAELPRSPRKSKTHLPFTRY